MKTKSLYTIILVAAPLLIWSCAKNTTPAQPESSTLGTTPSTDEAGKISESNLGVENASTKDQNAQLPTVHFDYDKALLQKEDLPLLKKTADTLEKHKGEKVTIEGNCDERGSEEFNLALGEQRATAVKRYLVKLGIEGSRVNTISYGKERPVDTEHNEMAWAKNRRADLIPNNTLQTANKMTRDSN